MAVMTNGTSGFANADNKLSSATGTKAMTTYGSQPQHSYDSQTSSSLVTYGMTGNSVKQMQTALQKAGYNISADGVFGQNTLNALKAYQKSQGLSADGVAGSQTFGKLYAQPSTPRPSIPGPTFGHSGATMNNGGYDMGGAGTSFAPGVHTTTGSSNVVGVTHPNGVPNQTQKVTPPSPPPPAPSTSFQPSYSNFSGYTPQPPSPPVTPPSNPNTNTNTSNQNNPSGGSNTPPNNGAPQVPTSTTGTVDTAKMLSDFKAQLDQQFGDQSSELKQQLADALKAQLDALAKSRDDSISAYQQAYNNAYANEQQATNQANLDYQNQYNTIQQQAYDQGQLTNVAAEARGIGNSQQMLGLMQNDQNQKASLINTDQLTRNKALADIQAKISDLQNNRDLQIAQANSDYGYASSQAQSANSSQLAQALSALMNTKDTALNSFSSNLDLAQQKEQYDLQNMAQQQQYTQANMKEQQQYNIALKQIDENYALKNMSVQQKNDLAKIAAQGQIDMSKISADAAARLQEMAVQEGYDKTNIGLQAQASASASQAEQNNAINTQMRQLGLGPMGQNDPLYIIAQKQASNQQSTANTIASNANIQKALSTIFNTSPPKNPGAEPKQSFGNTLSSMLGNPFATSYGQISNAVGAQQQAWQQAENRWQVYQKFLKDPTSLTVQDLNLVQGNG